MFSTLIFNPTGELMKRIARILVVLIPALILMPLCGRAQSSELRSVRGTVVDKSETSVASAVVYLKNARTLTVKTYISEDRGQYHFSGLDPNSDYEIHAERGDLTSSKHTVSSFDSRKEFVVTLKLDREKKKIDR